MHDGLNGQISTLQHGVALYLKCSSGLGDRSVYFKPVFGGTKKGTTHMLVRLSRQA